MKTAYLSLGSNIGDREEQLKAALALLDSDKTRVVRQSSIYETEPRDFRDQPWFLNMVVEVETPLSPLDLLARIQEIENELGRERAIAKGPRSIDIDILTYEDQVVETEQLQIPHPRLTQRRFVLEPLAEIAPNFRHPKSHASVANLVARTSSQPVKRFR